MTPQVRPAWLVLAAVGVSTVVVVGTLFASLRVVPGLAPATLAALAAPPSARESVPPALTAGSSLAPSAGIEPSPTPSRPSLPSPGPSVVTDPPAATTPSSPAATRPEPARLLDTAVGTDVRPPVALPARADLYAGSVSVTPGQALELHVSTLASSYRLSIARSDATRVGGEQVVLSVDGRPGHDYRARATYDNLTRTARANWPVTDRIDTTGWSPGIYIATAADVAGTLGRAIVVVRDAVLVAGVPVFVFSALTYQAYNLWGGGNFYTYGGPKATRVSFERPYDQAGGRGFWTKNDDRILAWLQQRVPLQYTTDYDLSVAPPTVVPRLLVFPRHTEYVPASLRDWLEHDVNDHGFPNVLSLGANGFYWQVRLAAPRTPGAPQEIVCYKSAEADPVGAAYPSLATVRWQDPPLDRPEGGVLGSQFAEVVADGYRRYDYTVTPDAPAWLLEGTGWTAGTIVQGLLQGEADAPYPASGGVGVLAGAVPDPTGHLIYPAATIRVSPAGARLFNAGSFGWSDGLTPSLVRLGVAAASFDRLNENVLAWLGFPPSR